MATKKQVIIAHGGSSYSAEFNDIEHAFLLGDRNKIKAIALASPKEFQSTIHKILTKGTTRSVLIGALNYIQKNPAPFSPVYIDQACITNPHLIPVMLDKKLIGKDQAGELVIKAMAQAIKGLDKIKWQFDSNNHLDPAIYLALRRVSRKKDLLIDLKMGRNKIFDHNAFSITSGAIISTLFIVSALAVIATCPTLWVIAFGVPFIAGMLVLIYASLRKDIGTLINASRAEKTMVSALKKEGLFQTKQTPAHVTVDEAPALVMETTV